MAGKGSSPGTGSPHGNVADLGGGRQNPPVRWLRGICGLLVCMALAGIGLCCAFWLFVHLLFTGCFDDPADGFHDATDAQLIAVFQTRRADVERLRAMHREDGRIGAIGTDNLGRWWRTGGRWHNATTRGEVGDRAAVLAAVGLPLARDAEYRRLFAATGAYRVQAADVDRDGYDTEICLTRRGTVVRSICKSFVFAPGDVPPRPLVAQPGDSDEERFTPLGDGWYLRYVDW